MKDKCKILLLFPHYNSLNESGSLRSPQVSLFLKNKGHEVTVFAPGVILRTGKIFAELKGKLYSETIIDGVRVIRPRNIQNFRTNMMKRLLFEIIFTIGVISLLFKINRPDIIIGAYPPAILPSVGLLIAKLLKKPFIFEVRDLMADALVSTKYSKSSLFNKFAIYVENTIYRKSNHIITVSDGIKNKIMEKGIKPEKITPIKNGYEPQVFQALDYSIKPREKFGWGNRFVVIYAGGLTQSYDIITLLKSAEITRNDNDILYSIIGDGEKKDYYIKYCKNRSLENVQFLDVLPRKMIPIVLESANVGVHLFPDDPLWSYVLGNKPFDYLGSGLPMIYSGRGDTADLVMDAKAGFVVHPEKPQDLAERIIWLKNNKNKAIAMGERGRTYVKTNFNRFKLLEKLNDVILSQVL